MLKEFIKHFGKYCLEFLLIYVHRLIIMIPMLSEIIDYLSVNCEYILCIFVMYQLIIFLPSGN